MPAKKTTKPKKSENQEPSGAPKVFDVAKPGETAADASSRPLIVGHGSIIKQDPMVVDPDPAAESKPVSKRGVSIQPTTEIKEEAKAPDSPKPTTIKVLDEVSEEKPDESVKKEEAVVEPKAEKVEEPTVEPEKTEEEITETKETDDPKEEPAPETKPEEETVSDQPESSEVAATNALANELVAKKAAEEKAKEAAKKAEEFQSLINSKKYFVNIHQSATSGGAGKWILLLLLLLIAGAVAAIDAGLVETSITLPFDLIQNQ